MPNRECFCICLRVNIWGKGLVWGQSGVFQTFMEVHCIYLCFILFYFLCLLVNICDSTVFGLTLVCMVSSLVVHLQVRVVYGKRVALLIKRTCHSLIAQFSLGLFTSLPFFLLIFLIFSPSFLSLFPLYCSFLIYWELTLFPALCKILSKTFMAYIFTQYWKKRFLSR